MSNKEVSGKDDEYPGLYQKYKVYDADTDEPIRDFCFVLKPPTDPEGFMATWAYAEMIDNPVLTNDLMQLLHNILYRNPRLAEEIEDRIDCINSVNQSTFASVFSRHFDNEVDGNNLDVLTMVDILSLIFKRWKVQQILPINDWGLEEREAVAKWVGDHHLSASDVQDIDLAETPDVIKPHIQDKNKPLKLKDPDKP